MTVLFCFRRGSTKALILPAEEREEHLLSQTVTEAVKKEGRRTRRGNARATKAQKEIQNHQGDPGSNMGGS